MEHFVRNSALRHLWTCLMSCRQDCFTWNRPSTSCSKQEGEPEHSRPASCPEDCSTWNSRPVTVSALRAGALTLAPAEFQDPDVAPSGPHVPGRPSEAICPCSLDLFHGEHFVFCSTGEVPLGYLVPARPLHAVCPSRSGRGDGDTGYAGCERALRVGEPAGHSVPTSSARGSGAQSRTLPIGLVRA